MADPVAIVGALTGIGALVLSVFQELRHRRTDRADIRLKGLVEDGSAWVIAVNAGRRSLRLKSMHMEMSDGTTLEPSLIWSHDLFPKDLDENEDWYLDVGIDIFAEDKKPWITGFFLRDSLEGEWRLPSGEFLNLQGQAREALARRRERERAERDPIIAADLTAARKEEQKS